MAVTELGREILGKIPRDPGVYILKDGEGGVLYIGKARDLRGRVKSYFDTGTRHSPQKAEMVRMIADVDCIVVDSEEEALILEANLIKFNQPPYNVDLKDGKQYPYIKITEEAYPAICVTRDLSDSTARYYGPFTSARAVKNTVKYLTRAFKLRECRKMKPGKGCTNKQIKLCSAPCSDPEANLDYLDRVKVVDGLLRGRGKGLISELVRMMKEHTKALRFEEAAALRDIIADIKRLDPTQSVSALPDSESDVFVIVNDPKMAADLYCVLILKVRNSKVISENFFFVETDEIVMEGVDGNESNGVDDTVRSGVAVGGETALLRDAILRYYVMSYIPQKIILGPAEGLPVEEIEATLGRIKGSSVRLVLRPAGRTRQLLQMAKKNALLKIAAKPTKGTRLGSSSKDPHQELTMLKEDLGLPRIPYRIEAFDISNLQGGSAVGSLVTFLDGMPSKKDYRRYSIRTVSGINDFEMMKEVVQRRYSKNPVPDLILIDGGSIQVEFAVRALGELGIEDFRIIGLAKRNEEVFFPDRDEPLVLDKRRQSLLLLRRVRDESHRFAVSLHRKQRKKRTVMSELDSVPGLGVKRRRLLLRRFGSVKRIKEASTEELQAVPGIGPELAMIIKKRLGS